MDVTEVKTPAILLKMVQRYILWNQINIHSLIHKNFKKINCSKSLKKLSMSDLNKFQVKKFDFVIAEGFLNTLEKRNQLFSKLTNFMKSKSFLNFKL